MAVSMDLRGYLDSFIKSDGVVDITKLTERVNTIIRDSPQLKTITSRPLDRELRPATDEDIKTRLGYIMRIEKAWKDEFHGLTLQPDEVSVEPYNNCQLAILLILPTDRLERALYWRKQGYLCALCAIPPFLKLIFFNPTGQATGPQTIRNKLSQIEKAKLQYWIDEASMYLLGAYMMDREELDAQNDAFEKVFVTTASDHGGEAEDPASCQLYLAMCRVVALAGGAEALADVKDDIQYLVKGRLGSYQFAYLDDWLTSCVARYHAFRKREAEEARASKDSSDELSDIDEEKSD